MSLKSLLMFAEEEGFSTPVGEIMQALDAEVWRQAKINGMARSRLQGREQGLRETFVLK